MQAKGLTPTVFTYGILFLGMCKNCQCSDALALFRSLGSNEMKKEAKLLKKNEYLEAEIYLEEMINRGFLPDSTTFSMALRLIPNLGQDSRMRTIVQKLTATVRSNAFLKDELRTTSLSLYSTHFNQRKPASGATKVDDALQMFDEMLQRQPPPSIFQFTKLITAIVNMKHYSTALILFKKIKLMGMPPDLYAMNISIKCHCRLYQVTYAFALLATIFKQGHPPNLTIYTTLINGLVLADQVVEAVEMLKKLLREKLCEPDQIMFGTVINGLCKVGHTSKALELLRFMEAGSWNPTEARELFNEMQAKGQAPGICTYRILFHGMCKNSQCSDALALFRSLGSKELMKDVLLHNILIDGCSKCGKANLAMDLFDELLLKGLKPTVRTYTVMIPVYFQEGLLEKGKELVRKMEENGCLPDRLLKFYFYNQTHNSGLCNFGRETKAAKMLIDMEEEGVSSNRTLESISFKKFKTRV
ncbi:hypothetical protein L1987_75209 [Smallanthus sonchifolius]|uniref:Uncharacterized protein n=1 Tax=Smallanthus sonchifolius TaxID=185202 RepID=A0ACB9A5Q6_9ASTR|nr:hypothetical protein L1987_75209 [Smallanthus sonchifolius]